MCLDQNNKTYKRYALFEKRIQKIEKENKKVKLKDLLFPN